MTSTGTSSRTRRLCAAFMVSTALAGLAAPVAAQETAPAAPPAAASVAPQPSSVVRSINVVGNQRLEPETVISYMPIRIGQSYTRERLDEALRDLYATELFADVQIRDDAGALTVQIRENPVINRIILEGNKRIKNDKISPEIRLAPRQIYTRSKVRADVARIIELYRRQGRFGARVDPKIVELDQNRVDVVFEIEEGPRSKVRQINIIGNEVFGDGELRGEMVTKQARFYRFFSSSDVYDPDRLAYDQAKLREFYLTNGYADFRVVSAVAELTPDRRDFIITYVVEEGERYKYGDVKVESEIRDFSAEGLQRMLPMKPGDWYNAKLNEDTVESLNETAGLFGYAFADVQPDISRNREDRTMAITFRVEDAPRVYVERVDINGNTATRDKVIRREFRLAEGDPFNSIRVARSRDRLQSLGFFQENLEIEQEQVAPDRVVLGLDVEEKATGELQLSAGFSSLERFLLAFSIQQRNFMGKGQILRAGINYSSYSRSAEIGFTEPYLFDRPIAVGFDLYRRDYESFNFINDDRNTTYKQLTTGGQLRAGLPLTEYVQLALRYSLSLDEIGLDEDTFFSDPDGDGLRTCDPLLAGRYLCEALGERTTSSVGYSLVYSTLNNSIRPSAGHRVIVGQDFAGVGGDVHYLRTRLTGAKYWNLGDSGFIFSVNGEGGYIHSFDESPGPGIDPLRLTDRFFLGESQLRGFDIRGVGPRIQRIPLDTDGITPIEDEDRITDDALGGRAYYVARAELEIPLGSGARELGLRPSVFVDVGALWGVTRPEPTIVFPRDPNNPDKLLPLVRPILDTQGNPLFTIPSGQTNAGQTTNCPIGTGTIGNCTGTVANTPLTNSIAPFLERFVGNSASPRLSVGFGVNWNSPFGPLRIDIAKALLSEEGDDEKLFTFNVGTAF